jgi:hypothetical protein
MSHRLQKNVAGMEAKIYKSIIEGYNTYPSLPSGHTCRESDKGVFTKFRNGIERRKIVDLDCERPEEDFPS